MMEVILPSSANRWKQEVIVSADDSAGQSSERNSFRITRITSTLQGAAAGRSWSRPAGLLRNLRPLRRWNARIPADLPAQRVRDFRVPRHRGALAVGRISPPRMPAAL